MECAAASQRKLRNHIVRGQPDAAHTDRRIAGDRVQAAGRIRKRDEVKPKILLPAGLHLFLQIRGGGCRVRPVMPGGQHRIVDDQRQVALQHDLDPAILLVRHIDCFIAVMDQVNARVILQSLRQQFIYAAQVFALDAARQEIVFPDFPAAAFRMHHVSVDEAVSRLTHPLEQRWSLRRGAMFAPHADMAGGGVQQQVVRLGR